MTPKEINGVWWIETEDARGEHKSVGPFDSNTAAWRWIDRQEGQPISKSESRSMFLRESQGGIA